MNTANKDLRSASDPNAQIYGPARIGAGRINLPNAGAQSVIAFDKASPNLVSVSFGTLEVTGTTTLSRQATVLNKGEGVFLWDVEGKRYFDFLSAYSAVN